MGVRNENYELDILKAQDAETVNYAVQNWNSGLAHQQDQEGGVRQQLGSGI